MIMLTSRRVEAAVAVTFTLFTLRTFMK